MEPPFQIIAREVITLKTDMIKIASGANCLLFTEPGAVLNAFHSSLTHSPNNLLIREALHYDAHFTDEKKQNKTEKAQQNLPKLREVTVCTQRQSGDVIPEPTLPITRCTGESRYRRDKGEGREREETQGMAKAGRGGSTDLPCSPQSPV